MVSCPLNFIFLQPMFRPVILPKSPLFVLISQLFHTSPTKSSQLLLPILLEPRQVHAILPFGAASRSSTRLYYVFSKVSYAPQLFDKIPHWNYKPILSHVFDIVQSVMDEPSHGKVSMAHALAVKHGADLRTMTSLLTAYSRIKEFDSSRVLFDESLTRDVVFWNAMMSACVKNKHFQAAIECFREMVGGGNEFDSVTLVILISAFSNLKSIGEGEAVHGLSIKSGLLLSTAVSNSLIYMYAKCGDLSSSECVFSGVKFRDLVTWNSIISSCFYNNKPDKSLWYFKSMACFMNRVDDMSISCAIAACTSLEKFDIGLAIHGFGIKLGYSETNHISVDNSLISFYCQLHDMYAAHCVFSGIVVKNVISWNAIIKGLFLNGEAVRAFYLLHEMQYVALIKPDIATVVTVIPFCAELLLLREGKAFHGFAVRREMVSEISVVNSLINMYSKCSLVKEAEHLFCTTMMRDGVSWNNMIYGYAQNGRSWESQLLFKKMLVSCSMLCSLPTILAIAPSCDSPDSLQFGRSIHGWSIKLGFSNHIFVVNSFVNMYISCGAPLDAFTLFRRAFARADGTSWNTVISCCTQKGYFWEALDYFDLLRTTMPQVFCNAVTLLSAISACGNLGLQFQGRILHGLGLKNGLDLDMRVQNSLVTMYGRLGDAESARQVFELNNDHNLCSWNCILSAMSQNDDAKKALELFRCLEFEPNEITISTVLSACTHLGAITYGQQIHGHSIRSCLHHNPFICAALIDMYSNCGKLNTAERVFQTSLDKSVSAWNSLISAYGYHNLGPKAIETFQEMIRCCIRPTSGSFTSLLSACSHSGMVDVGRRYYNEMFEKFKVQPGVEHHVCMVDMLGRLGRLHEAYDFIERLGSRGVAGVWGALLSGCSYHGDVEMGKEVSEILFKLEPENVSYYVCLCNMYIGAGRWEEAVKIRGKIEYKQLKKPVAHSFIHSVL